MEPVPVIGSTLTNIVTNTLQVRFSGQLLNIPVLKTVLTYLAYMMIENKIFLSIIFNKKAQDGFGQVRYNIVLKESYLIDTVAKSFMNTLQNNYTRDNVLL